MPRDGSGTYTYPVGTRGIPATPIESLKYNNYIDDIAIDLNTPRPIAAGGTGGANVNDTLDNLSAEKFKQVVTNWDTAVWRAGSFYAATTAIGVAPIAGHAFAGICYFANATDFVCEATDLTDPLNPVQYIRIMTAGVWGTWTRLGVGNAAANLGEYTFDSTITFPPTTGQIRLNNATQNSATEIFISHIGALGGDNTGLIPFTIKSGSDIIIQDKDEGPKYKVFSATADPVLSGSDFRVTVTFKSGGADLVSAQRMLVGGSTGGTVLYNVAQTLTPVQQTQARQNIFAAPFDAMAYSGMQVNGSFDVSQFAVTPNGYLTDGWLFGWGGTAVPVGTLYGPDASFPGGVSKYFGMTVATAQASMGAGDFVRLYQFIEGYRLARLGWGTSNAQPLTIGFWTAHNLVGTYSVAVQNSVANRAYAASYMQNVANAAEYKTITIPGDTAGAWLVDTRAGLMLQFCFASGATYIAPAANTWYSTNYIAAPGQINAVASTSNVCRIAGVVVLPGIEAPSAARSPLIMRPYDQELITCQRYWCNGDVHTNAYGQGNFGLPIYFPVSMRATPTIVGVNNGGTNVGATVNFQAPTIKGVELYHSVTALGSVFINDTWTADARL